ncbi:MAG: alpha/beta hydrolase [Rhodobacteraceae bacterium]|nr:alpha/beta hydrolase [Paracoccaceae bacterium]
MSVRLAILNFFTRVVVKNWLSAETDVPKVRAAFERHARWFHVSPPLADYRDGVLRGETGDCAVKWVSCGNPVGTDILFYIHGGGFITGSPETHKHMVAHLCRRLDVEAVMPWYRLAPENPFPAGFDDVVACYHALLASGRDPKRIIIGGDSAGGGLMLSLLAYLSERGLPMPLCCFAISPATDFTNSGASKIENAASDAVFNPRRFADLREMYLAGQNPELAQISPLFAKYKNCPPVLFHVCDHEILRDDTLMMQSHLLDQGAEVLVRSWPNAFHVFHLMVGYVPEAKQALDDIAGFVISHQIEAETKR